jgi:hypothetical protein
MAKRRRVRKHSVYVNLNVPELTKAGSGLELYLFADGEARRVGDRTWRHLLAWRQSSKGQADLLDSIC